MALRVAAALMVCWRDAGFHFSVIAASSSGRLDRSSSIVAPNLATNNSTKTRPEQVSRARESNQYE